MRTRISGRQTGSATATLLVSVAVCATLSATVLLTNSGRHSEAQTDLDSERAFQLAEAGADWAVTQIRIRNGIAPVAPTTRPVIGVGSFTVRYSQGDTNHIDDNGDGVVDDPAEAHYASMLSTGTSGRIRRTVQIVVRKAFITPQFDASLQLNVTSPIIDLSGNAFTVDGTDHNLDGSLDTSQPAKFGIASPAAVDVLVSQVPSKNIDQIKGLGGSPSLGSVPAINLNGLVDQVRAGATVLVPTGTQTNLALGTTDPGGSVMAYCGGDLHLSGNGVGAGILAVDGDLQISGGFTWVGIIVVRGAVTLTGGGGAKRIIGALAVGQDITATTSTQSVDITGTVDIDYSSAGVALAADSFSVMTVQAWREVGNP